MCLNNNCQSPQQPCEDCTATLVAINTFCDQGCVDTTASDCVEYVGNDIVTSQLTISKGDNLTAVIQQLAKNNLDVALNMTFNATTRQLCLSKNGVTAACVIIPDSDDQYLQLDGTILKIFRPGTPPVLINSVDLSPILPSATELVLSSTSLSIIQSGVAGHTASINLVPSSDLGNALVLGTDGKPYVPSLAPAITDVVVQNSQCLTWAKTFSNGVITYVPTIDWACVAAQVCPLCAASCTAPSNLTVQAI